MTMKTLQEIFKDLRAERDDEMRMWAQLETILLKLTCELPLAERIKLARQANDLEYKLDLRQSGYCDAVMLTLGYHATAWQCPHSEECHEFYYEHAEHGSICEAGHVYPNHIRWCPACNEKGESEAQETELRCDCGHEWTKVLGDQPELEDQSE